MPIAHEANHRPGVTRSESCDRRVTVVVVHRNRPDVINSTVGSYLAQPDTDRVIVVDNGSGAAGLAALDSLPPDVDVVITGKNLGFGPGANVGIRRWLRSLDSSWVAVTPHDADPAPDALARILDEMEQRDDVGLVSADVGDGFRPIIDPFLGSIDAVPDVEEGFDPSDYPHGTLMLARRQCLQQIGLFDERYFAYCEEADLGLRAARSGWRCGVVRGAGVGNPGMSSAVEMVAYLQLRNTLLMLRDHYGRWNVTLRAVIALTEIPIGLIWPSRRGLHWSPRGRLTAIRHFLIGRFGPPPPQMLRQSLPRNRPVSGPPTRP